LPRTLGGWVKVRSMLESLTQLPLGADAATEGKKVIGAMLIVGLVFISVIALGQLSRWLRHRRY
jgi:hypothetical protein